jgi:hypothetical protein
LEDDVGAGFINATRQTWKFNVGWGLVFAGCLSLFGQVEGWWGLASSTTLVLLILGSTSLSVAAFTGMILSIRCPHCGLKILWQALRTQPALGWMVWLNNLKVCPSCGYEPSLADLEQRTQRQFRRLKGHAAEQGYLDPSVKGKQ